MRDSMSVGFKVAEITAETNPTEEDIVESKEEKQEENTVSTVEENNISDTDFNWGTIIHEWFSKDDLRQKYVNYAYKLGGWDFVYMMECENWNWSIYAKGDSGNAIGLCQMNRLYHKDIPQDYFTTWQVQVEYCYQKWKSWTVFYGPQRMIKWKRCYEYVKDRFTFIE